MEIEDIIVFLKSELLAREAEIERWRMRALKAEAVVEAINKTKNCMNIENLTVNGGEVNIVNEMGTMNIYGDKDKQAGKAMPSCASQDQVVQALTRLAAGELTVGRIADTCWWGVHKFLTEYKLISMTLAEFGVYLVNKGIRERDIYENFRKVGQNLTMLSARKVTDWNEVDGATTEIAQRQIDVVKCLQRELCGE